MAIDPTRRSVSPALAEGIQDAIGLDFKRSVIDHIRPVIGGELTCRPQMIIEKPMIMGN